MRYASFVLFLLILLTQAPQARAEDVLEVGRSYWLGLTAQEKIVYVEGYIGGLYCMAFVVQSEDAALPEARKTVAQVCAEIDAFYAEGSRYAAAPVYMLVYETMRRKAYSYY
jgi:hypothetical protein